MFSVMLSCLNTKPWMLTQPISRQTVQPFLGPGKFQYPECHVLQSPSGAPSTPRNVSNSQRGHASGWTGSARRCIVRHKKGLPFSLEHPGRSIALDLEEWKSLMSIEGVYAPSITPVCSKAAGGENTRSWFTIRKSCKRWEESALATGCASGLENHTRSGGLWWAKAESNSL